VRDAYRIGSFDARAHVRKRAASMARPSSFVPSSRTTELPAKAASRRPARTSGGAKPYNAQDWFDVNPYQHRPTRAAASIQLPRCVVPELPATRDARIGEAR
jgi:hypothetical protein